MSSPAETTKLLEMQLRIRQAVLGGDPGEIVAAIRGDDLDPAARLGIYRNHAALTFGDALKAAFPVVCRLVDDRFFAYAAHEYLREHPPHARCLVEYGADFAQFLAAFEPCRDLLYLPDVARFEWALHIAATVREEPPMRPDALAAVPVDEAAYVGLRLQPSVSYVDSPWPVDLIWQANREEDVPAVDLSAGGAALEIRRAGGAVIRRRVDRGTFVFRTALADGLVLAAAMEAATLADPAFDLTTALRLIFAEELAVGFVMSPEKETTP
jgi:hypothetical protein